MTNNTEAVIKATTEYNLAEAIEECNKKIADLYPLAFAWALHYKHEHGLDSLHPDHKEVLENSIRSTLDRLKRRGE